MCDPAVFLLRIHLPPHHDLEGGKSLEDRFDVVPCQAPHCQKPDLVLEDHHARVQPDHGHIVHHAPVEPELVRVNHHASAAEPELVHKDLQAPAQKPEHAHAVHHDPARAEPDAVEEVHHIHQCLPDLVGIQLHFHHASDEHLVHAQCRHLWRRVDPGA